MSASEKKCSLKQCLERESEQLYSGCSEGHDADRLSIFITGCQFFIIYSTTFQGLEPDWESQAHRLQKAPLPNNALPACLLRSNRAEFHTHLRELVPTPAQDSFLTLLYYQHVITYNKLYMPTGSDGNNKVFIVISNPWTHLEILITCFGEV